MIEEPEKNKMNEKAKNISIDILRNTQILKEIFSSSKKVYLLEELSKEFTEYAQSINDSKTAVWFQREMGKIKEDLLYCNLNSNFMKNLMTERNLSSNINYYKQNLQIYDNFFSRNYHNLQLIRLNYIFTCGLGGEISGSANNQANSVVLSSGNFENSEIKKLFEDYIDPPDNLQKKSSTFVLHIITSLISIFYVSDVKEEILLTLMSNLVLEFKNSLSNKQNLIEIPYEISTAIEDNLNILLNLIITKILKNQIYDENFKSEIIVRLISILQYYKSQSLLIRILLAIKEYKIFNLSNLNMDNVAKYIFNYKNDKEIFEILINKSIESADDKNQIILTNLKDHELYENQIRYYEAIEDDKYYYLILNNIIYKIGTGKEDSFKNQTYNFLKIGVQKWDEFKVIMKGNCLYILFFSKETLEYYVIDKSSLQILNQNEWSRNENGSILNVISDDLYFYVFKGFYPENTIEIFPKEFSNNSVLVHRIKSKKYNKNKFNYVLSFGKCYYTDVKEPFIVEYNPGVFSFYTFCLFDIIYCENSKTLSSYAIELNKKSRFLTLKKLSEAPKKDKKLLGKQYNQSNNNLLYCYHTSKDIIDLYSIKVFTKSPYQYNFLSKSFIKDEIIETTKQKDQKNFGNSIQTENRITKFISSIQKKDSCLSSSSVENNLANDCSNKYYNNLLYYLTNYLLTESNSSIFNHSGKNKPFPEVIKLYTSPISFSCSTDNNMFKSIVGNVFLPYLNENLSNEYFNFENLSFLIIIKNYLQNLTTLGINANVYFENTIDNDLFLKFVNLLYKMLNFICTNNHGKMNADKYQNLYFNEVLNIFSILIKQKFPIEISNFMLLVNNVEDFEKKIKIFSNLLNLIKYNNIEEMLPLIISFEKEILLNKINLEKVDKYMDLAYNYFNSFKYLFIKAFGNDLLSLSIEMFNCPDSLPNKLLKIFVNELILVLKTLNKSSEENLIGNSSSNFMRYINHNSIIFNITFLLLQIYTASYLNDKENQSKEKSFPTFYLKLILNLYIELEKLLLKKGKKENGDLGNKEDMIIQEFETDHPLSSAEQGKRIIAMKVNTSGKPFYVSSNLLNMINKINKVSFAIEGDKLKKNLLNNLPIEPLALNIKEDSKDYRGNESNEIEIKVELNVIPPVQDNSEKEIKFKNDYGIHFAVNFEDNESNCNSDILTEIRRLILFSINLIISDNLSSYNEKENYLFSSIFNTKLLKNISLPDSGSLIKRENIKFINEIISDIEDTERKSQVVKQFAEMWKDDYKLNENINLLRTYSMEMSVKNVHDEGDQENYINLILNSNKQDGDPLFFKGFKYLQKALQMKIAYLVNLGGCDIEPLVLHIFVIILKFQNLVTTYVEKYLNEIFVIEFSNNADLKTEDLNKIEIFKLFLKIWTECSKIRIFFSEQKKILAENLEKNTIKTFDEEVSLMILNLTNKANFFLTIIQSNKNNTNNDSYSQETIDSVMTCIKTEELTLEKITSRINLKNEKGIKRETGLILLNMMMKFISHENETDLNDLIFTFNKVMKKENKIINLIDDLIGADYKVIERVSNQFHLLIENLLIKCVDSNNLNISFTKIALMQALIWKLKGRDYPILNNLNIFENFTKHLLKYVPINKECNLNKVCGVTDLRKSMVHEIFNQLFEIYTLQIFRKINQFKNEEEKFEKNTPNSMELKRSQSYISEEVTRKMIEFVLKVMIEAFDQMIDNKLIKSYLVLLYRCIGYNSQIFSLLFTVNPNLIAILLVLYECSEDLGIKLILIKIFNQFIMSLSSIDLDLLKNCLKQSNLNLFDNSNEDISVVVILLDYFCNLITENSLSIFINELTEIFKQFLKIQEEPIKTEVLNFMSKKINSNNIDLILFILGVGVKFYRIGTKVLIRVEEGKQSNIEEYKLLSPQELNFDQHSLHNYKKGYIIGFIEKKGDDDVKCKNPFEMEKDNFEFNPPYINLNYIKKSSCACVVLEENLVYQTVKNTSFIVMNDQIHNLMLPDTTKEDIQTDYFLQTNFIEYVINEVILNENVSTVKKYMSLKFLYNSLSIESLKTEILNQLEKNEKLFEELIKYATFKLQTVIEDEVHFDIENKFISLECLEELLKEEIIFSNPVPVPLMELFEYFKFSFGVQELKIKLRTKTDSIPILISLNNEHKELHKSNYTTNKLSLYREKESQRLLNHNSIMFADYEHLTSNQEEINKIIKEYNIRCILTVNKGVKNFAEIYSLPMFFITNNTFYSLISYFFFGQEDSDSTLNFNYNQIIKLNIQKEEINVVSNVEMKEEKNDTLYEKSFNKSDDRNDSDAMIFFPGFENDTVEFEIKEDKYDYNRNEKNLKNNITKFHLQFKYLKIKLCSLISRRIVIKILSLIGIDNIQIEKIISLLKLLNLEYLYNLTHHPLGVVDIKNLISEFILSFSNKNYDNLIKKLLNLKNINSLYKDNLKDKFVTANTHYEKHIQEDINFESLEVNIKTILFIFKNKYESISNLYRYESLFEFINTLIRLTIKTHNRFFYISESLEDITNFLFNLINSAEKGKNNYSELISYMSEHSADLFPLEEIKNLIPCLSKILTDKYSDLKIIDKEETHLAAFMFSYFDIILVSKFKYNVNFNLDWWFSTKNKIFDLYYSYCIFKKKFEHQGNTNSPNYLSFLTLLKNNEALAITSESNSINSNKIDFKYYNSSYQVRKLRLIGDEKVDISIKNYDENNKFLFLFDQDFNLQEHYASMNEEHDHSNLFLESSFKNNEEDNFFYLISTSNIEDFKHNIYAMGDNKNHELSTEGNHNPMHSEPIKCAGLDENAKIKTFKYGYHHIFALDYNGELYVSGTDHGSGLESHKSKAKIFTKNNKLNEIGQKEGGIKNVYVNNYQGTIILTNTNKLYGVGYNYMGVLSNAVEKESFIIDPFELSPFPEEDRNIKISHVAMGFKSTMILLENGKAYTIGENKFCQTGDLNNKDPKFDWYKLTLPDGLKKIITVSAGEEFYLLLIEDMEGKSRLCSMGNSANGRSGVGVDNSYKLRKCQDVESLEFKFISTRNASSAAITKDGKLYTFGENLNGCLGLPNEGDTVDKPKLVEFFSNNTYIVDNVSIGSLHMVVIARKLINGFYVRKVFSCGVNSSGALGFNDINMLILKEPKEVEFFNDNPDLIPLKVFCSKYQSYILTIDKNSFNKKKDEEKYLSWMNGNYYSTNSTSNKNEHPIAESEKNDDIIFSWNTYIPQDKIEYLNEELNKLSASIKENASNNKDSLDLEEIYTCQVCMKTIDLKVTKIHISTENLQFIICNICFDFNSSIIEYPQIFYTFKNINSIKKTLAVLPKIEFSKSVYNFNDNKTSFSVIIQAQEKIENSLRNFYNSLDIIKLVDIMKKLNLNIALEYSELRDEYVTGIKENRQITYEEVLSYLESIKEQERFILLRRYKENPFSKIGNQLMEIFISKINEEIFRLISLNNVSIDKSLLGNCIRENFCLISSRNRKNMFYVKLAPMCKRIEPSSHQLKINRYKARKFYERNVPDITGEETIFGQMYQKMKTVDSKIYCSLKDNRLFQVNLVGEGATDYGGPYRDVFHAICEELQSNSLDLFIKSPNNKSEVGSYRDRYIINPSANLEIHSNMYKFLGHLMGNALCTGNMLNLVIHPFIWKLLIESEVKFSDFETIDVMFYKLITDIEKIDCTQQQFDDMYDITFSIQLSNGKEVELLPGGRNLSVSIANKNKFVELAKACRLSEFNKQIANLREGLYKVIPDSIIQYLTSRELEEIICGKPTINLAHLKLKTVYESYNENDQVIKWFWEVLEAFKDEEKVLYLKYVWGRSRLPNPDLFPFTHKISKTNSNNDRQMPKATTCYFTLILPNYSNKNILNEKLKYVILNCNEIDADFTASPIEI